MVVCNTKLGNCNKCPAPLWITVFQYGTIQSAVLNEADKCLLRTYYVPASGLRVSDTLLKKKETQVFLPPHGAYILTGETDNRQKMKQLDLSYSTLEGGKNYGGGRAGRGKTVCKDAALNEKTGRR